MRQIIFRLFITSLIIMSFYSSAEANSGQNQLEVKKIWATPTFPMAMMGAAYITLHNNSETTVEISGVTLDAKVASMAELHESFMQGEMAKMRELPMPFRIAPDETVEFQPGGKHIMIMGLKGPLEAGTFFELSLQFVGGGEQSIVVPVLETKDAETDHSGHHHHH